MKHTLVYIWFICLIIGACSYRIYKYSRIDWVRVFTQPQTISKSPRKLSFSCEYRISGQVIYAPLATCSTDEYPNILPGDMMVFDRIQKIDYGYLAKDARVISKQPQSFSMWWLIRKLAKVREWVLHLYGTLLPYEEAQLLSGIVLGEQQSFSRSFTQALKITGTMHVVAASGYNVAVIIRLLELGSVRVFGRKWGIWLTGIGLWIYVLLLGAQPPILRASLLASVGLWFQLIGRPASGWMGCFYVLVGLLIFDPSLFFSLSFQLSVSAFIGVTFLGNQLVRLLKNRLKHTGITYVIEETAAITLAATAATAPILCWSFGSFSWLGLVVNPIILWMVPLLTYGGIIVVFLGIIWSSAAWSFSCVLLPFLWLFTQTVNSFGSLSIGLIVVNQFHWLLALGWWVMLVALTLYLQANNMIYEKI